MESCLVSSSDQVIVFSSKSLGKKKKKKEKKSQSIVPNRDIFHATHLVDEKTMQNSKTILLSCQRCVHASDDAILSSVLTSAEKE